MRNFLVGLLWLWFLVSLGVYAVRLYRRFTRGKDVDAEDAADAPPERRRDDVPMVRAEPVPVDPAPVEPVPVVPTSRPASSAASGRTGLFAPATAPPPASTPPAVADHGSEARPTVAEVLQGIAMPCDLVPIVDATRPPDAHRVAFSTHTAAAPTIGAAVADELERLGFDLVSTGDAELTATRDGRRVVTTIHPDPEAVHYAEGQAFPPLPRDSVVVEFRT